MQDRDGLPPPLDPARDALFLDFDGTLVEIAPRPGAVIVPPGLVPLLLRLSVAGGGAVAIVSGRSLPELARFLEGFDGAMVGSHGAERRGLPSAPLPEGLADLQAAARLLAEAEGLHLEIKTRGVALHYRQVPERSAQAEGVAQALAAAFPAFAVQPAKMAFELKPRGVSKDAALAALMDQAPFAGRRPVYLGDDATDEPAIRWCADRGGYGIKVGTGDSAARCRLDGPQAVLNWLGRAGG